MESGSPLPPLPRSYDDTAVCQLYPLHDAFLARDMEQPRFSRTQEGEWFVRIAKDVRGNECAVRTCFLFSPLSSTQRGVYPFYFLFKKKTDTVKRWLRAVSLSNKREFCNFVPPLTDEAFELFVQFFWLIKVAERPKANQLLSDIRRQWGLENRIDKSTFNEFLASGDDAAFALSSCQWPGQVPRLTGKAVSRISAL